ncbi:sulfotransferase domain-containing protein [Actinocatenispora sera]|uniref:sulfotransferase domain-containing protein n=1 Tax=Actinocatenispora sera TaxID=390989 RepID=UPI0033E79BEE
MIVWLASYPRSGNTLARIALHRLYGVPTYVVYEKDGVAERIGSALMGARERPAEVAAMQAAPELYFVKTHRPREPGDETPSICLVRDGRDAAVSWARLRRKPGDPRESFAADVRGQFTDGGGAGAGAWATNVLSWLDPPVRHRVVVRYEDLIADPLHAIRAAVRVVAPGLTPQANAEPPTFTELQRVDAGFFRRGIVGSHRDELDADLVGLFWEQPLNVAAMRLLTRTRHQPGRSDG